MCTLGMYACTLVHDNESCTHLQTRDWALASMARDDPPTSSTAASMAAAVRGKVGSEFET